MSAPPQHPGPEARPTERLLSVDVLRGFDMFWIIGGETIVAALCNLRGGAWLQPLRHQFDHADWAGLRAYDVIFPLFVFVVGVAVPLSLGRIVAGGGRNAAIARILRRTLLLFLLGVFYYGGLAAPLAEIRWLGVLQRIALCYGAASLLYLFLRPRGLWFTLAGLLVGYWALLTFVPVPGFGAGDFAESHNFANWIDARFLPGKPWNGDHDPEGILSTLPAIASCLLGVLAGITLSDPQRTPGEKIRRLVIASLIALAVGFAWSAQFPIIKRIWTSSFVLVAGGWSGLLLAGFYWVIDVRKIRAWATPFAWIGANALTIYLIAGFVDFPQLATRLAGGSVALTLNAWWPGLDGLVLSMIAVGLAVGLCGFLYRRKIFLKI